VNPHGSVFGGALTALGLVGAWMLLFASFAREGLDVKLVGKQSRCDFLAPATGDCIAETRCAPEALRELFAAFRERGRARQALDTLIRVDGVDVARHHGVYTALHSFNAGPGNLHA
jgi:thioesterase domain-containing protein